MGTHDNLPHEFEHTSYTFDVVMDQGAFYEVKRHRMMTQSPQTLGAELGYATPHIFKASGLMDRYQEAMSNAAGLLGEAGGLEPGGCQLYSSQRIQQACVNLHEHSGSLHIYSITLIPQSSLCRTAGGLQNG